MSYTNDIASPEVEIAGEAAGSFFADARNKHSDLKTMLDGNKDSLKMEAMKRIINMIAKGKDASDLFPAVVKNVAAKNAEVKKLVYVYLMRYAEEQQDLALLSISTFQRALKDPNQLIRASALRVLSSIRVPIIVPIMMLSIKESMRDMSPYVRKVAAHAISKLYSIDPELKDQLIEVIDHLLADKTTLVLGSAVHAFEEVCPERIDLIHKHYRKLCQLLVDVDEWGQVIVINMLTRYARTQFEDPNLGEEEGLKDEKFYSSDESSDDAEEAKDAPKPYVMDPDLRMLLRNTKPLLQSRNSAVVLSVCQLYFHLAPKNDIGLIAKALIRLLRNHREIQSIVLTNIATISAKRRNMFEPYLKSFFVRSSDPTHIKLLKLEILTNLATQTNISIILREFQTYVATHDKEFAAATIDAIGRCACNIKEVTDVCLSGLVHLMANKNETVVAQSVVVIKKLLQLQPSEHQDIITQMAKLIDTVKISAARASIICLIGEYCQACPRVAPDVLRKMAKSFVYEDEYVKLQVLNLGVKLFLTNPEQTEKFVNYIFQLARYDQSYDLRDRARFLRNLVFPSKPNKLTQFAKNIFLTPKPAPTIESSFKDRDQFQLGTLSHYLNQRCVGYNDLPPFPIKAPDVTVRNQEGYGIPTPTVEKIKPGAMFGVKKAKKISEKFYSDDEDEEDEEEEGEEEEDEEEEEEEEDEDGESSGEEESSEEDEGEDDSDEEESEEEEKSDEEDSETEEEEDSDDEKPKAKPKIIQKPVETKTKEVKPKKSEPAAKTADLLLDFDFDGPTTATSGHALQPMTVGQTLQPTGDVSKPTPSAPAPASMLFQTSPAQFVPTKTFELLNKMSGRGLIVNYRFTRSPSLFSSKMCSVEIKLNNQTDAVLENIKFGEKKLHHGMELQGFSDIPTINMGQTHTLTVGVDFADTTQAVQFDLIFGTAKFPLTLSAPVGEQLQPIVITPEVFKNLQSKLSGMNETVGKITLVAGVSMNDVRSLCQKVYEICNVVVVNGINDKVCFAGQTLSGKAPVLITFSKSATDVGDDVKLIVNCEKMVIGSMLFKQLKAALAKI